MYKPNPSVRGKVLTIALVPGLSILILATGGAGYFIAQGAHAKHWTDVIAGSNEAGKDFVDALQQERRVTMLRMVGDQQISSKLAGTRARVDNALAVEERTPDPMGKLDPDAAISSAATYAPLLGRLPSMRGLIDTGAVAPMDAYQYYNQLTGLNLAGMNVIARTAPDSQASVEQSLAQQLFFVSEALSRATALSAFAVVHGVTPQPFLTEFWHEVGMYRSQIAYGLNDLPPESKARLQAIVSEPAWQRLGELENAIVGRGVDGDTGDMPAPDIAAWQTVAGQINQQLLDLFQFQENYTLRIATANGDRTMHQSILAGGGVLLVVVGVVGVTLLLSGRLTRRLKQLRRDTLDLANRQLPAIMERLQQGEPVDVESEVRTLDYGKDEIGQVGDAFNQAQLAAVTAAVVEARTREGVKAVFLNIAHRSQLVMHRMVEILDHAEYDTENPAQLDLLFRLDHLATRERRNAENLIILGGKRPGRLWRNPVALDEIVRGAVSETENYRNVYISGLPELSIIGSVVADVVHLLAELVDNASTFSPPQARVDITGNIVGRGVVVEIVDQGLGMSEAEFERANSMLADAPDFSINTLSSDPRLGLFVVAQLARQYGIKVHLTDSDYSGVRAMVIIPVNLIASEHPTRFLQEQAAQRDPTDAEIRTADARPHTGDRPEPNSTQDRAALPRRKRAGHPAVPPTEQNPARIRPHNADEARDLLAAIENGTRRGRADSTDGSAPTGP